LRECVDVGRISLERAEQRRLLLARRWRRRTGCAHRATTGGGSRRRRVVRGTRPGCNRHQHDDRDRSSPAGARFIASSHPRHGSPTQATFPRLPRNAAVPVWDAAIVHDDELLAEQRRFYRARAPEYDDWWQRRGPYDHGDDDRREWDAQVATVD